MFGKRKASEIQKNVVENLKIMPTWTRYFFLFVSLVFYP